MKGSLCAWRRTELSWRLVQVGAAATEEAVIAALLGSHVDGVAEVPAGLARELFGERQLRGASGAAVAAAEEAVVATALGGHVDGIAVGPAGLTFEACFFRFDRQARIGFQGGGAGAEPAPAGGTFELGDLRFVLGCEQGLQGHVVDDTAVAAGHGHVQMAFHGLVSFFRMVSVQYKRQRGNYTGLLLPGGRPMFLSVTELGEFSHLTGVLKKTTTAKDCSWWNSLLPGRF